MCTIRLEYCKLSAQKTHMKYANNYRTILVMHRSTSFSEQVFETSKLNFSNKSKRINYFSPMIHYLQYIFIYIPIFPYCVINYPKVF